jgi:hypothetical protein
MTTGHSSISRNIVYKAVMCVVVTLLASLTALAGSGSAIASGPTGNYAPFADCPYANLNVKQCIAAQPTAGEIKIGRDGVPISRPLVMQGGTSLNVETGAETFYPAADGNTMSQVAEPVPGGLRGILSSNSLPAAQNSVLQKYAAQGGSMSVTTTTELVGSVEMDSSNLVEGEGVAMRIPVKLRLNNVFLGNKCYIGSDSEPIVWNLTVGVTDPPPPNRPIAGFGGKLEFREEGDVLLVTEVSLVDNAFAVPAASGCGGPFGASLVDSIIDAKLGLPSPAGMNSVRLFSALERGYAPAVRENADA